MRPVSDSRAQKHSAPNATGEADGPALRPLLRWLLGITRPVHGPLFLSAACRIINLSLDLALFGTAAGGVVAVFTGAGHTTAIIVALVVLSLVKAGMFYLEQFTGHYVAFKALELLRIHVFASMWPKAPAIVSHSRSGDVLTSLTRDVDRIEVVYAHTFAPVVAAYVVGVGAIITAGLTVGWAITGVAAGCLAFSLLIVPYMGVRSSMAATRQTLAERRDLAHHVTDSVYGLDEVLGYGLEEQRLAETDAQSRLIGKSSQAPRDWAGIRRGANVAASLVAALSIVWFGRNTLSPIAIAALAAAALRIFEGPRGIEDATGYLDHSLAAARRLWHISHIPARVNDGPDNFAPARAPAISISDVSYAYPSRDGSANKDAVSRVSISIPAGGHAILVGRSGSGKSTLVQLLQRYDDPRSGAITVDGQPLANYTLNSLRSNIVSVSQKNQLLETSLADNLRLGAADATDDELWAALSLAGLADEIRAMPDGLATHAGRNGSALSGGQAQRLCLARALLMKPSVLILDEFTANLDMAREAQIRKSLAEWEHKPTIIEVTHRLRATANADLIAVMDHGEVIASGTPAEITEEAIESLFQGSSAYAQV